MNDMKIYFEYGRNAISLPLIPQKLLLRAGKAELKLLLALAGDSSLAENYEERADALAADMKISRSALDSALSFWVGAGVLSKESDGQAAAFEEPKPETKPQEEKRAPLRTRVSELPQYTSEEFAVVLERRAELSNLIEEAQGVLEKVFNVTETQTLVSISEGLGLDDEYILNLLAYCKRLGKPNLRYVEKTACSLYDKGVCTAAQLEEYLRGVDKLSSAEGKIRKIFGMGERAFTSSESRFVSTWINDYKFDFEIIKLAYEETVNATSKPSMQYANKVLENWYAEGLKTPDDVARAKEKRKGVQSSAQATSFNVDDFFNAAINNGFGDDNQGG